MCSSKDCCMVCHVIIPKLTLSFSQFQSKDGPQLFWHEEKLPGVHVPLNRNASSSSPFLRCRCLTLDLLFFLPSLLSFPSHKIFRAIHASGLKKSNLSCWKRKCWKPLVYFMVISCDRGGGGEQQLVSTLKVEEVMVLPHLYSLPQTVTTSNGSDIGTKRVGQRWRGGCRDWRPFDTPVVAENGQNCLRLPPI